MPDGLRRLPGTAGDHETCPTLCADCRERLGWVCCECAVPLPDAEHGEQLCDVCHGAAMRDKRDEYRIQEGRMTPNQIEALVNCYVLPDFRPCDNRSGAAIGTLIAMGLVEKTTDGDYVATPLGRAHMLQLCDLPLPRQVFVGFDGKEIQR